MKHAFKVKLVSNISKKMTLHPQKWINKNLKIDKSQTHTQKQKNFMSSKYIKEKIVKHFYKFNKWTYKHLYKSKKLQKAKLFYM